MQTVTLSFFRFTSLRGRLWAFAQMQFAHRPLSALPGLGFYKLMGTGTGESFTPFPNFGVYAILATWPSEEHARAQIAEAEIFRRYRARAAENWTAYLDTIHASGKWDSRTPFEVNRGGPVPEPVAILTRASIRPSRLVDFWRHVPPISDQTGRENRLMFKLGMGEIPWVRQVTFSIWEDIDAMRTFAYRSPFHRDAAKRAQSRDWFSEDLFARFRILGVEGEWDGRPPVVLPAVAA
jgi:spheroidene monooxygenase